MTAEAPGTDVLTLDSAAEIITSLRNAGVIDSGATYLDLTDPDIPYDEYESLGRCLGVMNRACMWWIGDWLNYGEGVYGDRYHQAALATGLSEQTLMNRKSICKKIPKHRRKVGLKFSVHSEVAYLPPREQIHWLSLAAKHDWGQRELRERIDLGNEEPGALLKFQDSRNLPAPGDTDGDGDVDGPFSLIDVARAVIRDAVQMEEGWLVPSEDMNRLVAACGWSA